MKPDFDQIKRSVDIVRVIESSGIELKREGKDFVGLCPFHEDNRPSLRVTPDKGLFRCMACNETGNVIQFLAKREGLTLHEAGLKLARSIPGVMNGSQFMEKKEGIAVDAVTRAKLLARVVAFYAKTLFKDQAGLEYLKTRRLDDPAMLERFQVGYCNGSMRGALPKSGEIIEQLKSIGILNERGNECFYGRVTAPIFDGSGNVVGLYGRQVEAKNLQPKSLRHLYLRGERRGVFNGTCVKRSPTVIVTEAILDAMSLYAAGFHQVISLYGKEGWTTDHETLLREGGVTEIVLALDADQCGQEAMTMLEGKLSGRVKTVHRIAWPEGVKDANDFFSSPDQSGAGRNADEFQKMLDDLKLATEPSGASADEKIILTKDGFTLEVDGRRYEVCAIEKPSPARMKATLRATGEAQGGQAGRLFHIDTVDFYLSRSRKGFIGEVARLFRATAETIEGDLHRLTVAVEKCVSKQLEAKNQKPMAISAQESEEAVRMGESKDLLGEIQSDLDKLGVIGERSNRLLIYLGMTSRKREEPLAIQILSGSGAGKSHLQEAVLSLCPEEDLIKLTSLTDQALFYKGEESLRHKCLAIAEVAGAGGARYPLRNLISEKRLVHEATVKNPLTGRLETQVSTVYGPTAVFETTTDPQTDPETRSRYWLLSVDESPEQTKAILEAQRQAHTLEGIKSKKRREAVCRRHHAFQRLLKSLVVVNPYEPLLRYGGNGDGAKGRLTFRRDHPKYLQLILAVTFLHQMQRPIKHDVEIGDYLETTLEDIAIANDLAGELLGAATHDLSSPSRELLRLCRAYVMDRATKLKLTPEEVEFSRRELREALGWSEYRLRVHLRELVEMEYLAPLCGRFGSRYCYRLLAIIGENPFMPGLKTVEQLRKETLQTSLQNGQPRWSKSNFVETSLAGKNELFIAANSSISNGKGVDEVNLVEKNGRHRRCVGV